MSELIKLTAQDLKRSCIHCENAYIGTRGIFCAEFREFIEDDTIAFECDFYEIG